MAVLNSGQLDLPPQKLAPWLGKVKGGSTIASLTPAEPMTFGKGQAMTFDIGEAEYVDEGAQKGSSTITPKVQSVDEFKFHKTVRMNEEVLWADEDSQLAAVDQILALIQPSLSRALDFGGFHGINPATGQRATRMTKYLSQTTNVVEIGASDKPYSNLDAADQLVLANSYTPGDLAIDPTFASKFSTLRAGQTEQKLYPNFKLTTDVSELDGHRASVSNTVAAIGVAAAATNVKAFVGDFGGFRWGIQRQIGLELIKYGDPDGQGDLKRNNQVAFRAEVVYGWGIADVNAFAQIVDAA